MTCRSPDYLYEFEYLLFDVLPIQITRKFFLHCNKSYLSKTTQAIFHQHSSYVIPLKTSCFLGFRRENNFPSNLFHQKAKFFSPILIRIDFCQERKKRQSTCSTAVAYFSKLKTWLIALLPEPSGSLRIAFSSSAIMRYRPSNARCVT